MAAIGDAWAENAWIEAGWVTGAWQVGVAAAVARISTTAISISIGIQGIVLLMGRAFTHIGGWW